MGTGGQTPAFGSCDPARLTSLRHILGQSLLRKRRSARRFPDNPSKPPGRVLFDTYVFSRRGILGSSELELGCQVVDERLSVLVAGDSEGVDDFPGLLAKDGAVAAG